MVAKWKCLKRSTRAVILVFAALSLFTIIAYASGWLSKAFRLEVGHGPYDSFAIIQPEDAQEVVPGGTINFHPQVKNDGNTNGMAIIHITYPVKNDGTPAYTWTVGEGWTKLADGTGYTYYGYTQVLAGGQETTELCDGMTLKEMSGEEFTGISDLGVGGTGYFFPAAEYGEDISVIWNQVKDGI